METTADRRALCERYLDVAGQGLGPAAETEALRSLEQALGVQAYTEILYALTRQEFPPEVARDHWRAVVRHREQLTLALGRDVGLRVALCDYFVNIASRVKNPVIVEVHLLRRQEEMALKDDLTGLSNRRHFNLELARELERYRRFGEPFSLVLLDLDHFKIFNDTFGHQAGDEALKSVAEAMLETARAIDLAVRYGGEEFILILPQTGKEEALVAAERLREAVAERRVVSFERDCGSVTVSAGVASFPEDAYSTAGLVRRADQALYRAKATRNTVFAFHDESRKHPRLPVRMEAELHLDKGGVSSCWTRDMSLSGLLCEASGSLPLGTEVDIVLRREGREIRHPLRAKAVRVTQEPGGGFTLALNFHPSGPARQDLLLEFLAPHCARAQ
ncbi:MAG TPA: hypothetical protein DDW80_07405 [Desulfovibrio sp.]|nr:hypothetical protein [Desulfovibrio sp.]